jgi:2-aminomuconate deaminase
MLASGGVPTALRVNANQVPHFPDYRRAGDFIFVSGTTARRADGSVAGSGIAEQTRAVIEDIREALAAAGTSLADIVDMTAFLVSMNDFAEYDRVYGEYFDEHGPARTTVAAHQLPHPQLLIEIKATAWVPPSRRKT